MLALGHATTRDFVSFLRFDKQDDQGNANPLGGGIRRVYADGCSQTGGYIRDFIYLGFNGDEQGRRVFDGMIPECAGTDRVFINVRFADPNTWSDEDDRHDFLQSSYPPFQLRRGEGSAVLASMPACCTGPALIRRYSRSTPLRSSGNCAIH